MCEVCVSSGDEVTAGSLVEIESSAWSTNESFDGRTDHTGVGFSYALIIKFEVLAGGNDGLGKMSDVV